jgi:hypothetical protein
MAEALDEANFRFLYRQAEGVIDAPTWLRASFPPIALALGLLVIALLIAPDQPRDLASEPLFDAKVIATHIYFLVCAFAVILCAVAEYFVSAKRFTDRGKPAALAGLAPFALLLAGAAHWYQPRSEGTMPEALTYVFYAVAAGIIAWNVIELGFGASRRA